MARVSETVEEARLRKRAELYHRTHQPDCSDKFRAIAEWWRLSAEESAVPERYLAYAAMQDSIADDMERRPGREYDGLVYPVRPIGKAAA